MDQPTNPIRLMGAILLFHYVAISTSAQSTQDKLEYDPLQLSKVEIIDQVFVPAKEAGVIDSLTVKEGDLVEKGQLLASIEKEDAELAVEIAEQEFQSAKKQASNLLSYEAADMSYKVAQAEFDSSEAANKEKADTVTEMDMRRRKLQAERAKMQIQLAAHELTVAQYDAYARKANLRRARAALKRRDVISPINGVVVKLNKHEGDWAQPGETIMRIVRLDQLRVEGSIDGTKYARHAILGKSVTVRIQLTGGEEFRTDGVVDFVGALVEHNEYTIRVTVDNRRVDGNWLLTPGLDAKIELQGLGGSNSPFSRISP